MDNKKEYPEEREEMSGRAEKGPQPYKYLFFLMSAVNVLLLICLLLVLRHKEKELTLPEVDLEYESGRAEAEDSIPGGIASTPSSADAQEGVDIDAGQMEEADQTAASQDVIGSIQPTTPTGTTDSTVTAKSKKEESVTDKAKEIKPTEDTKPAQKTDPTQGAEETGKKKPTQGVKETEKKKPTQGAEETGKKKSTQGAEENGKEKPTQGAEETGKKKPTQSAEPTEKEKKTEAAAGSEGSSEGKEAQMFPADRVSEGSLDIRLSHNDILMMGAGTVLQEEQVDLEEPEQYFMMLEISEDDDIYRRISGRSLPEDAVVNLSDLRYLKLLHYNYDGRIQIGEMIVSESIAEDVLSIFLELFRQEYQVCKMRLVDDYWNGDGFTSDLASIKDNNTAAYCYRTRYSDGGVSVHAYGTAIDINPLENPEVRYLDEDLVVVPEASSYYAENRSIDIPHVITEEDAACRLFLRYGFSWGGLWRHSKDYKHFERD